MPRQLTDRDEIRKLLNGDRVWSLYALADLDEEMFEECEWWGWGEGLALVFHGISIRPIFVLGDLETARALLSELNVDSGYLNLREHQLPAAEGLWKYRERHDMHRMVVEEFHPRPGETETLGPEHAAELMRLYCDGDGGGIAFAPFQMQSGFFRGIRRNGELVAAGGVHVVSKAESVAGVGNIFTHADWRGRGLAQTVTSAVVRDLQAAGITTIGLNVEHSNAPAIAAYERLGFRTCFRYVEGPAQRGSRRN